MRTVRMLSGASVKAMEPDQVGDISRTVTIGPAITAGVERDDYGHILLQADAYLEQIQPFFPSIKREEIHLHQCGIQARLSGQLDWHIRADSRERRFINLLGIDSPGMTAFLALGQYVADSFLSNPDHCRIASRRLQPPPQISNLRFLWCKDFE